MSAWRDGRVIVGDEASLADDRGRLLGDGLFETIRVVDGRAAFLDRHVARLTASAAFFGIATPPTKQTIVAALADLHAAEGRPRRGALRVTLSRGRGRGLTPRAGPSGLVLTFDALPDEATSTPLRAVVVAAPRIDPRDPLAGHKTLSRMSFVHARRTATERGADVALLTTVDGDVAEADAANLFVVTGGALVTPPLDRGVLPGITRARCLRLENCVERRISIEDLARAEEAFLTSSLDGVRPLAEIDGRALRGPAVASSRLVRKLEGSDFPEVSGPHNASR